MVSEIDTALAGWKRCELTPAQTRTELESLARNLERQRDAFVDAAQCYVEWTDTFGEVLPDQTRRALENGFGALLRAALSLVERKQNGNYEVTIE